MERSEKGENGTREEKEGKRDTTQKDGEEGLLSEQGVRGHPDTWIHLRRQESTSVRIYKGKSGHQNNYFTGRQRKDAGIYRLTADRET